jgi:hypothetical protein
MYRYGMSLSSLSEYFVFDCIHDVFTDLWAKRQSGIHSPSMSVRTLLKALKNRMQNQILRRESKFLPLGEGDFDELWEDAIAEESNLINSIEAFFQRGFGQQIN